MMNTTATSVLGAAMAGSTGSIVVLCVGLLVYVCALLLAAVLWDADNTSGVAVCLMAAIITGAFILIPM